MSIFKFRSVKPAVQTISAVIVLPAISLAQEVAPKTPQELMRVPEVRAAVSACTADVAKFCASVKPGEGRIVRCLVVNINQLDPPCVSAMVTAKAALGLTSGAE